jgi:hypothetical protein
VKSVWGIFEDGELIKIFGDEAGAEYFLECWIKEEPLRNFGVFYVEKIDDKSNEGV